MFFYIYLVIGNAELAADLIQLVEPAMNVKIMLHPKGEERCLCVKSAPVEKDEIVFQIPIRVAVSADAFDRLFAPKGQTDAEVRTYETENELKNSSCCCSMLPTSPLQARCCEPTMLVCRRSSRLNTCL